MTMQIPTIRCCVCDSPDLIAVAPGVDAETCDLFTLRRGEAAKGWCAACWPWRAADQDVAQCP